MVKVEGHFAVLHLKDGVAQLLCAHQHIVGHGVAAEQGLAVVGGVGLSVGPCVVFACGLHQTFHGGKVIVGGAGGGSEGLPVGVVEEQQLGGLCHRENLHLTGAVEVALGHIAVHELCLFSVAQVGRKVYQHAHLVDGIGGVGVGRENVGHGGCAHLALGRVHDAGFQIIDAALTLGRHLNAFFSAHRLVEFIHQLGKAFQLVAVVVSPHCDIRYNVLFLRTAASRASDDQRRRTQQADPLLERLFHKSSPQGAAAAEPLHRHTAPVYWILSYHVFPAR